MDLIYDSLIILAPIWILWLYKNYSRKRTIFFGVNVAFFLFSPILLLLALFIVEEVVHYLVLIYIWSLISYFLVSMLLKKYVVFNSVILGLTLNALILYSLPSKPGVGYFYYWSYWRQNSYALDINAFKKYQVKAAVDTQKMLELVKCEINNNDRIDMWKFNVNYKSDRDTLISFEHLNSFGKGNCQVDFFEFTSYRVPSESSQFKALFDKKTEVFGIISIEGKPARYLEGFGGMKELIQALMVDFDFYNDFLTFRWENGNFWENVATDYSDNAKNIEKLAKCTKMKL